MLTFAQNTGQEFEAHLHVREDLLPYVDDTAEWDFAVYSLLRDSFLSSTWVQEKKRRDAVSTYAWCSTYRKSNLGREYSASSLRASSNSREPGE